MDVGGVPADVPRNRASLRLRLAIVCGGAATAFSLLTLLMSVALVDGAAAGGTLRVDPRFVIPMGDGTAITVNQFQQDLRRAALVELASRGLILLTALSGMAFVVSYGLVGRALLPLQRITETARGLSASTLDARIGLTGPDDELTRLADTFDGMLDRLQAAFDTQRRFVVDAGHELRTPVAVVRTEIEVALADPDAPAPDLRESMSVVLEANRRIEALIESLLVLADAYAAVAAEEPGPPVALDGLVAAAVASAGRTAAAGGVALRHLPCASGGTVQGDARLLAVLVGALVENAVLHNRSGGTATAQIRTDEPGRVRLRVINDGPVVETALETLAGPFRRGGTARTGRHGAGLGLAVAVEVARAHGGKLTAAPRPEGGLDVTVDLPAAVP